MKDYLISDLLDEDDLSKLNDIINSSDEYWKDGSDSVTGNITTFKNNFNLKLPSNLNNQVSSIVYKKLDSNLDFKIFTACRELTIPRITKTPEGGYYLPHHDVVSNGDFSTTVFLNSPDEYDGGELSLYINGEVKQVKLKPGQAITYKTGIAHQVNTVTRGNRYVIIFWTTTKIKDELMRECWQDIQTSLKYIDNDFPQTVQESQESPYFILKQLLYKIERKHLR